MAGFVGYRKSAWDNATAVQKAVLKTIINQLELGDPVLGTVGSQEWYVFHSSKINARFVENLAWFNTVLASITTAPDRDYPVTEIVQVEVPVRVQVEVFDENGDSFDPPVFRWVDHPTDTELVDVEQPLGDPLTLAADAQGAVAWFSAASSLPANWTPVDSEE